MDVRKPKLLRTRRTGRGCVRPLLLLLFFAVTVVSGGCAEKNTFENFTGEYQYGFPDDTGRDALAEIAKKCGNGSGVRSASVGPKAADGSPLVVVRFERASTSDRERVTACAKAAGSDFTFIS